MRLASGFLLWGTLALALPQDVTTTLSSTGSSTSYTPTHTVTINGTATEFRNVFTIPASADEGANIIPNVLDPEAKDAQSVCPGYNASEVKRTAIGFTASLSLAGSACNVYGTDIEKLTLTVEYQATDRLHVEIIPANVDSSNFSHYILSEEYVKKPAVEENARTALSDSDLQLIWSNEDSFHFSITRQSTGDTIFSTAGHKIVFENQFIEFGTQMPKNYNIYGLGEAMTRFKLQNNLTRTIYAADIGDPLDENLYGSHPFYLDTRYYEVNPDNGRLSLVTSNETDPTTEYASYSHGVYLRNAHAQEVILRAENITWRTIGGSIDLYFYAGPTQADVSKSHIREIGLPAMQQYWTFGFHQCRWGYHNWSETQDVVDNFAKFGIPLEAIWLDIDVYNQYRDFENDPITFPYGEGQAFIRRLHENNQHWIPIVDSAIYIPNPENASDTYPTYNRGKGLDVFMKNPDGSQYIGAVWPGYTVFPDWLSAGAQKWWTNEAKTWHDLIGFSGYWVDMNEVSSFCVGSCGSANLSLNPAHVPFSLPGEPGNLVLEYPEGFNLTNATEAATASLASASQSSMLAMSSTTNTDYFRTTPTPGIRNVNQPPYAINNVQGDLAVHAMSPNATHANGYQDYDVHNLYGHQILNATYNALLEVFPDKRPFIIGRSTFPGSGSYAGHWGGDNTSKWYYMFFSIPQALSFSLFGIPMFGVDTCGFSGASSAELCSRWMQLSAFFPFYRNHNVLSAPAQEPYVWLSVIDASKSAMSIRYALLPYLYTLFYHAHTTGATVMRALAWEFPNEPALAVADRQFMLGDSLLITPVLVQGATSVDGVFPGHSSGTVWYDWYTQTAVQSAPGQNATIAAPLGHIPVYVRGGRVLPMQGTGMTTTEARNTSWALLAALNLEGSASGNVYIDDGESLKPNATLAVDFAASNGSLSASARGSYVEAQPLANVTVLGVEATVSAVRFNGAALSAGWTYNATSKALRVTDLADATPAGAWASDWVLSWS